MNRQAAPRSILLIMLALGIACAVLFRGLSRPVDLYDEGVILTGGARLAQGMLPYRDFWTAYAPGQFFTVGTLFSLYGERLEVFRLYDLGVKLVLVALLGVAAFRIRGVAAAAVSMILAAVWLERMGLMGYTAFPALAAALSTVLLVGSARYLSAAVCLAITVWFRHDFGAYLAGILVIAAFRERQILKTVVTGGVLSALMFGVLLLYMPAALLWEHLVYFPLQVFPKVMDLPLAALFTGSPVTAAVAVVPFIVLLTSVFVARGAFERMLQLLCAALVLQVLVRSDIQHLFPMMLLSFPLLAGLLPQDGEGTDTRAAVKRAVCMSVLLVLAGIPLQSLLQNVRNPSQSTLALRPAIAAQYAEVQRHLPDCIGGIYILPENIRSRARGDVASYFLWQLSPPVRVYEPHPGVIDDPAVQAQVIDELAKNQTGCVLFSDPFGESVGADTADLTPLEVQLRSQIRDVLFEGENLRLARIR